MEEDGLNILVRHDTAPYVDFEAVVNMLHLDMWVLASPNPEILVVYSTMCVENGLVRENNFSGDNCHMQ
jgi:hypothetical protein